jgi:hypothetical protein
MSGNKETKYKAKPKFSREKKYATEESDIIKNDAKLTHNKAIRDEIRMQNLLIASGENITSNFTTEKKALKPPRAANNSIVVEKYYEFNDSEDEDEEPEKK